MLSGYLTACTHNRAFLFLSFFQVSSSISAPPEYPKSRLQWRSWSWSTDPGSLHPSLTALKNGHVRNF